MNGIVSDGLVSQEATALACSDDGNKQKSYRKRYKRGSEVRGCRYQWAVTVRLRVTVWVTLDAGGGAGGDLILVGAGWGGADVGVASAAAAGGAQSVVRVRRRAQRMTAGRWRVFLWLRVFQKKRSAAGRRQRSVLFRFGAGSLCAVVLGLMEVMVLIVATAFWAAPLRVMLEGRREQVAYWPGVMGVQLRTTVPLKLFCGVSWRL